MDSEQLIHFIQKTLKKSGAQVAVIAVSGGIDSALSLTLAVKAIGADNVYPLLLPYGTQDMKDALAVCEWNQIKKTNIVEHNIKEDVDLIVAKLNVSDSDHLRKGNIMARTRMIFVFDTAKARNALVVGTENKSEHYLGYFTRFGDEASDIEPICGLYKTQVRQTAKELGIPKSILTKSPSAGLWESQTDESEMGFSYEDADKVLMELIDKQTAPEKISVSGVSQTVIEAVLARVKSQAFKREVPYRPL
jgi:NAD+ synthase